MTSSEMARRRWKGKSKKEKSAHAAMMARARTDKMTPAELSAMMKRVRAGGKKMK